MDPVKWIEGADHTPGPGRLRAQQTDTVLGTESCPSKLITVLFGKLAPDYELPP